MASFCPFPPPINMGEGFPIAFNAWPNVPVFSGGNENKFIQTIEINDIGLILGYDTNLQKLFLIIFDFNLVSVPGGDYSEYNIQYLDETFSLNSDTTGIYSISDNLYIWYLENGNTKIIKLDFDIVNKKVNGIQWNRRLDLYFGLEQITSAGSNMLLSGSYWNLDTQTLDGLLFFTDHSLASCNTINDSSTILAPQSINRTIYDLDWWEVEEGFEYQEITGSFSTIVVEFEKYQICPIPFIIEDSHLLQSPYLHLQAAGSVGQESTAGIHLRWMLLRNLGNTHLPKGNYAETNANFNKPDDFVKLYRIPYNPMARILNLQGPPPVNINHSQRRWTYHIPNSEIEVILHFQSGFHYQAALNSVNPNMAPYNFIQAYGPNVLEVTFVNELIFAFDFDIQSGSQYALQLETFSVEPNSEDTELYLSARKMFFNVASRRLVSENMQTIPL